MLSALKLYTPFLVSLILGAGIVMWALSFQTPDLQASRKSLEPAASDPFLGQSDAPVTVVEVADIQCPGCKSFFDNIESEFVKNYVDLGKAKFYQWDLITDSTSFKVSEALRCANDQDKYWQYRNHTLVQPRDPNNWASFERRDLSTFAEEVGLDLGKFDECVDSSKYNSIIAQKDAEAKSMGITGSPAIYVNGRNVAPTYRDLAIAIDQELREK